MCCENISGRVRPPLYETILFLDDARLLSGRGSSDVGGGLFVREHTACALLLLLFVYFVSLAICSLSFLPLSNRPYSPVKPNEYAKLLFTL